MKLDAEKIKNMLSFDADVAVFESVKSTNDIAAEFADKTELPIIVAAEGQTDGKGRNGKSFFSPAGTGLYLSVVTHPKTDIFSLPAVTCGAAVAVVRAIEKLTGMKPQIKWVNDIYSGGRKVCGILCRALGCNGRAEHLVTGIGINLTTEIFPAEIKDIAGSLDCDVDRNILAAEIVNNLVNISDFMDEYKEKSCVLGREITYFVNNIPHKATALDIDENGGLIVSDGKEKTTLSSGEITVRL